MILVCAAALLLQAQDVPTLVAEQVARLKSDDPKIRIAATDDLVRLGRRAIPAMEATKTDDPEVRSRLARAISRIQSTEPFFLMRSADRRVSVSFRDLPFKEAHVRAFAGFPVPMRTSGPFFRRDEVSMTVDQAGYWEVVEKFATATNARLERTAGAGLWLDEGRLSPSAKLARHDRFLVEGVASRWRMVLRLYSEPGLRPVAVTFKLDDVTDGDGRSLRKKVAIDPPEQFWSVGGPYPHGALAVFAYSQGDLPECTRVNIDGTATVDLATDVEAVEFRGGDETRSLSEWRLSVSGLKLEEEHFAFQLKKEELKGWKPPEGRPYLDRVWLIVSDDEGRSNTAGTMGYGGSGDFGTMAGWGLPGRPTRLSVVRPTGIERVEVPVRLRGIVIPP